MTSKPNEYYIEKALFSIDLVIQYTKGKTYEEMFSNPQDADGICFRLVQVIEQIKNLPSAFFDSHKEIPWNNIFGFRNRIVHDYGSTDYSTVYEVVTEDIYQLKEILTKALH